MLNIGENISYNYLAEYDKEYGDIQGLKAAERYKRICKDIKENKCIYCKANTISIINSNIERFKCVQCKRKF